MKGGKMPSETKTTPLQQTAVRIRAGNGTKENARLIDQEFQRVKWQRIRELKRQTRSIRTFFRLTIDIRLQSTIGAEICEKGKPIVDNP
jgi:hypothetical protein